MEIINIEGNTKKINLYFIGDTHFPRGRVNKFEEAIDTIANDRYAKVIGLGDWVEAIIPGDPRYDSEEMAQQIRDAGNEINMMNVQWDLFEDMIKPIADQGKILGLHQGNHEYEYTKRHGYNQLKSICKRYDIKYLDYLPAIWNYEHGNNKSKIMSLHGVGSGVSVGYEIKQLDNHSRLFDEIDLIAEGHTHKLATSVNTDRLKITKEKELKQKIQWRCACGSFLGNYDIGRTSYSQRRLYKPLPLGYIVASLENGKINNVTTVPV